MTSINEMFKELVNANKSMDEALNAIINAIKASDDEFQLKSRSRARGTVYTTIKRVRHHYDMIIKDKRGEHASKVYGREELKSHLFLLMGYGACV